MIIISQYLLKLKQKTKKKNFNLNNTNILLNWFITFPEGVYGGQKVGNLDLGGEVFWYFGSGLRKKSWEFGILGWGGILELRIWT